VDDQCATVKGEDEELATPAHCEYSAPPDSLPEYIDLGAINMARPV
jgi:hypothetical protein